MKTNSNIVERQSKNVVFQTRDSPYSFKDYKLKIRVFYKIGLQRNWVYATSSNFLIPLSLQLDGVSLLYIKLRLFNLTEFIVWNIKGLHY